MRIRTAVLAFALVLAAVPAATAQIPLTSRALGMGGAYMGSARGVEALYLNPAHLALPDGPSWSVAVANVAARGTTLGPTFGDFVDLAANGGEEDGAGEEILAEVPESGMLLEGAVRIPAVAVQIGGAAFGVSYTGVLQQNIGRDVVDLLLNGYEQGRTDYEVGETVGSRGGYLDFAAAYGRTLPFGPGVLTAGVAGHYYQGRTIARTRLFEPVYGSSLLDEPIEVDYAEVFVEQGSGFGLDVGAAYMPSDRLTLSGAVTNLVGTLSWDDEVRVRDVTLTAEDFDESAVDIVDKVGDSERPLGDADPAKYHALAEGLTDDAGVPTVLRLGGTYRAWAGGTVGAAFQKELGEKSLSAGWGQMLGVGVEQKLGLLGLRAGAATGFDEGSMLSAGLSIGGLDFGVARLAGSVDGADRSGWVVTTGATFGAGWGQ